MQSTSLVSWYKQLIMPYRYQALIAIIALFIGSGGWLALGQGLKYGIDSGFINGDTQVLGYAGIGLAVSILIISIATYWRFYYMTWLGEKVSADIRTQVYQHMLTLGPSFYANTRTGEVISRFTSDTSVLQTVIGSSLSMAIRSAVTFIGALILMLTASIQLTVAVLISVPFILLPIRFLAPKLRKLARSSQDRVADLGAHIDQSIHEIATVQAYNAESRENTVFQAKVSDALTTAVSRIKLRAWLIALIMGLSMGSMVMIGWFGISEVINNRLSVGELTAFLFYAVVAGGSIATISEVVGDIQRGAGASDRLHELLLTENPIKEGSNDQPSIFNQAPTIEFSNIKFGYDPKNPLFNDFSLSIKAGEQVALVGPSGSGKTTVFNLLLRFWQPSSGTIQINGEDIQHLTLRALRQGIAVVDQSAVVFADTIINNIRYSNPNATLEQVKNAAKQAYADEFIVKLPNGYDTFLGERGVNLSGGQRQRIAIARAILADSPVLLLDEATSALDAESESHIQTALRSLMESRTTLVIAHRLATVKDVDKIVVMENGKIQDIGSHESLVKTSKIYKKYTELQLLK
ncbi:ATP-binding cassette domain-containing protein [Alteromonas sp. 5E99-2]|uniref:ABC transporter transmembrane domain-containing protein n=1 Tax=Alteromonas sp. 5E99-2 TaxID=2817683 RepID=UPI001A98D88C|nr:ABC transporter transmembrane domain-containing protein [Alteromonas sp. 5E99-2]MBO1256101.1 ATP-binding cassette domain-containing protein [Alteromonas sp. 5E99-2]